MKSGALQIFLAPLRGITDCIFRNAYARHFSGLDGAVAPFVSTVEGKRIKPTHLRDLLPENNLFLPVTAQILSKNPGRFLFLATGLERIGCREVNWNLGCPFARVVKKGRGAGLLPFPDKIDAFLETVFSGLPAGMQLSVKTRLGRWTAGEIEALVPVFNRYPLARIIIHPRTAAQMYTGQVDLNSFEQVASELNTDVIYNGDIFNAADFRKLVRRLPEINKWMIGRGVVADPLLPARIRGTLLPGCRQTVLFKAFHDDLWRGYEAVLSGPGHILGKMKGLWSYFATCLADGRKILKRIHKFRHKDDYLEFVDYLFKRRLKWNVPESGIGDGR